MKKTQRKPRPNPILALEINKELKANSQKVAETYGLNLSAFTRMLLAKSVQEHLAK